MFAILERFTPLVEPLSIDEAFLDVTGSAALFGTGVEIARAIKAAILRGTGLTASVGVAPNKFLAKVASDLNKPDGLTVVPRDPGEIAAFLAPLPVGRVWGVGAVTRGRLEMIGVRTIGDLQQVSRQALCEQVGRAEQSPGQRDAEITGFEDPHAPSISRRGPAHSNASASEDGILDKCLPTSGTANCGTVH